MGIKEDMKMLCSLQEYMDVNQYVRECFGESSRLHQEEHSRSVVLKKKEKLMKESNRKRRTFQRVGQETIQ